MAAPGPKQYIHVCMHESSGEQAAAEKNLDHLDHLLGRFF